MRWRWLVVGTALAVATGCGGSSDDEPDTATATVQEGQEGEEADSPSGTTPTTEPPETTTTTTPTTAALTPEQEVEQAYLRSWEVYTRAMRTLDSSRLDQVYAERALELRLDEVGDARAANDPADMTVEHNIQRIDVQGDSASVLDNYLNHSVSLDPVTGEPTEPDPNEVLNRGYNLRRIGETWTVVEILDTSS